MIAITVLLAFVMEKVERRKPPLVTDFSPCKGSLIIILASSFCLHSETSQEN